MAKAEHERHTKKKGASETCKVNIPNKKMGADKRKEEFYRAEEGGGSGRSKRTKKKSKSKYGEIVGGLAQQFQRNIVLRGKGK